MGQRMPRAALQELRRQLWECPLAPREQPNQPLLSHPLPGPLRKLLSTRPEPQSRGDTVLVAANPHLQLPLLGAGVEFKVLDADGCDDVALPPGVTGAVGEDDFVVALTCP